MNDYPKNWREIADRVKAKAGWRCERCNHINDVKTGHVLTVRHLVPDKALCEEWNLAALCQRCHLHIEAKVNMFQDYFMEHSPWFIPHLEGFLEWVKRRKNEQRN